jgi:hypothetical protein
MPVHDWTRVDDGIFHAFHVAWLPALQKALNGGLLPTGYYALAEQHVGRSIPDLLTLHASDAGVDMPHDRELPPDTGGTDLMLEPPKVRSRHTINPSLAAKRRSLAIRHVSGHRLVALLEIVSPANKDRAASVDDFAAKVVSAIDMGIHVLVVDLLPSGKFDPSGMPGVIRQVLEDSDEPTGSPSNEPLSIASYVAGPRVEVFLEFLAVGKPLPIMPLFLRPDRYINIPLEATYQEAYSGLPRFWRDVIEGKQPAEG